MCGRYAIKKSSLLNANSIAKKNINVDLEKNIKDFTTQD